MRNSDADKDSIVPKTSSKKTTSSKTISTEGIKQKIAVKKTSSAGKKTAAKKSSAAPMQKTAVKSTEKKTPAKKAASKKTASSKKETAKKDVLLKRATPVKPTASTKSPVPPKIAKPVRGKPLTKRELKKFQKILVDLRERLQGDIRFLTTDNLHRAGRETGADLSGSAQHSADHGTDNFDREFALSLASTEQDVLYEVDEALMRIRDGGYGVCEMTGVQIERARLQVIPYTRYSVQAQSKMEQSRAKYRPFAQTFKGW